MNMDMFPLIQKAQKSLKKRQSFGEKQGDTF